MISGRPMPAVFGVLAMSLAACGDDRAAAQRDPPVVAAKAVLRTTGDFPAYSENGVKVAAGERLFAQALCAECHSDVGVVLGAGTGNIDRIATAIRDGTPNGMPAYSGRLTDAQIWQLAAFVKALDGRSDSEIVEDLNFTLSR